MHRSMQSYLHGCPAIEYAHTICQEEIAPVEPAAVYTVNPDRVTLPAKSSCQIEFFGFSAQPGQIEEHFICTLGSGVKSKQVVFDITARYIVLASHDLMQAASPCPQAFPTFCEAFCEARHSSLRATTFKRKTDCSCVSALQFRVNLLRSTCYILQSNWVALCY